MQQFASLPPLSLYVHIPWCVRKCPYCDFNSHEARGGVPEQEYVEALLRDLEQDLPRVWGRIVHTIFIGGGTPSLFSPEAIDRLLSGIRARLLLDQNIEITLEANPGTVDTERFKGFRAAGINRLSIGVQSFEPEKLKALGRIHGREEALRAAESARAAGFDNFNLDLMFGLPGQTVEQALADIRTAIQLYPTHLSAYQLTIEPNTLFHSRPPTLPDDDSTWDMQSRLQTELAAAGYQQYEVSAYAKPGHECRHNLNYWQFGDYLGIGAGAHAKITDARGITRLWKLKQPNEYLRTAGTPQNIGGEQKLSREHTVTEFMMNALRITRGVPSRLFAERTGMPISVAAKPLEEAERKGLIAWDIETLRPTDIGLRFLNNLVAMF
ncbi:MAG: radical SAM family heme chaperone HemW [Sulfuricaulis sp.]|uniref:radical SAM family heme chaperone HemW n=1 Tax=Sulfuricaulis sp. TaxID=2003553 RepID=UPI0025D25740|nr:radical SAM family heme chaperone HemW [Sulfuricaulis sp.]MCR4346310.1 radical SAM family heme chaperone HemW [Sulfuricaulis sp.]